MIKNIIFDFGDVFINLDKEATYRELYRLGVEEISEKMIQVYYDYEKGLISTNDFVDYFHNEFAIEKEDLVKAWNAILLDFPLERLDFLKELVASNKYRLFLLSNTNDLHISWIQKDWGMDLYNEFKNCFEQFYLSHEIQMRKPNTDIYEFVLKKNNLIPSETIFIDDTLENTDAAEKLGIKTWTINRVEDNVVDLLNREEFLV
ncbi:putative hydrolase of the HAD superfamily [Tenacibaculum skagerrakense]|uniref:Putative hydrolase of the HAD superfamily n=1 Tax=Tenacibaculum skagerrakense TaxID=186571 RepID=A0A4R2NV03_9FLAO|nr:HAD family phosphatase [Tenacibaculum skagerrakense]TCP25820.1 putative hydrolase of the HAD superfamily [Tenacibaculum skagerrakense]